MPATSNAALAQLMAECIGDVKSPSYIAKMLHPLPKRPSLDIREVFFVTACAGQTVLDIGASGHLHQVLLSEAKKVYGIDRHDGEGIVGIDLDDFHAALPKYDDVTRVVCGEVLEHLSNPGWLLRRLRSTYPSCPLIVSVPNAFSEAAQYHIQRSTENVNNDHVAWYSPKTLEWLLARHDYRIRTWAWYKGPPGVAEGIVAIADPV